MPELKANKPQDRLLSYELSDLALGRIEGFDTLASQFEEVGELGYFIFDAIREQFLYVSDGFARIYGVDAKTHIQQVKSLDDDLAFVIEEDRDRVLKSYQTNLCRGINCVVEFRIRRNDGQIRWLRESSKALRVENGKVLLTMGAVQDVTSERIFGNELSKTRKTLESVLDQQTLSLKKAASLLKREIKERERIKAELVNMSSLDTLTGLPLLDMCCRQIGYAKVESRFTGLGSAILFVGLDNFSEINDIFGRETGDEYLKDLADRLRCKTRNVDTVARVGGDEFVVILCAIGGRDKVEKTATGYLKLISESLSYGKIQFSISASIGIARFPDDAEKAETLLHQAEQAMRKCKASGKNGYLFFDRCD